MRVVRVDGTPVDDCTYLAEEDEIRDGLLPDVDYRALVIDGALE